METTHVEIRTRNVKILAKLARTITLNGIVIRTGALKNERRTYKKYIEPIKTTFMRTCIEG